MTNTQAPSGKKPERINLRYTLPLSCPEGQVTNYLLRNPNWGESKGKNLLIEGAMLIWLPRVRKAVDPQGARESALHSVTEMQKHIRNLIAEFGLTEDELAQTLPQNAISTATSAAITAVMAMAPSSPATTTSSAANPHQIALSQSGEPMLPSVAEVETAGFYDDLNIMLN